VNTTFAIGNQKGGVAKTTTTWTLAYALAERDHKVLMVDLDPQASLSIACDVDGEGKSMGQVLGDVDPGTLPLRDIVVQLDERVFLAPSDIVLSKSERGLMSRMTWALVLKQCLKHVAADYILIDCPPSLGVLTINALAAADYVLIPALPEYLSLRGIAAFYETIDAVRREANRHLQVFGILPTFYDSRTLHAQEVIGAMEKRDLPVLPIRVKRSVRMAETPLAHTPILFYATNNAPAQAIAQAYRDLAEIIDGTSKNNGRGYTQQPSRQ
jgi:chromosome partitioning protein